MYNTRCHTNYKFGNQEMQGMLRESVQATNEFTNAVVSQSMCRNGKERVTPESVPTQSRISTQLPRFRISVIGPSSLSGM